MFRVHLPHGKGIVIVDDRSLGARGCPGCIDQRDFRVQTGFPIHRRARCGRWYEPGGRAVIGPIHHGNIRYIGDLVPVPWQADGGVHLGMFQQIVHLVPQVIGIDRNLRHAQPVQGQKMHHMGGMVVQRQRDPMPRPPASPGPGLGQCVHSAQHAGKADLGPFRQIGAALTRRHAEEWPRPMEGDDTRQSLIKRLHQTLSISMAMP